MPCLSGFELYSRWEPLFKSAPTAVVVIFYPRVFHVPLTLNVLYQKHIFATYDCTKELLIFMSLLRFFR